MKLGKRLKKIASMINNDYEHIWDCCCDHGFLGMNLLDQELTATVHFVDIVPELIKAVDDKLIKHVNQRSTDSSSTPFKTHCISTSDLPLESNTGRHLIIIAGVGGDLMIDFIDAINARHPQQKIDFILCPVHHLYNVRKKLQELDFKLKDEKLIQENQRFYEIIYTSNNANSNHQQDSISAVGDQIWQENIDNINGNNDALVYLSKTIEHYQRITLGTDATDIKEIIEAYTLIKNSYHGH